jgi:hypothetical protein
VSVIDELVRRSGGRLSEERARLLAYTVLFRGGGAATTPLSLDDLSDVEITNPQNGDQLAYDANAGLWRNVQ